VVVDLSRGAIAARQAAKAKTGLDGGFTGAQLVAAADRVFNEAKRLRKVANGRSGRRAQRASDKADEALRTAATQIRAAQKTPLSRGYLHALALDEIQRLKTEVSRAFDEDPAALAVDTHRRIQDQRNRMRAEGGHAQ
jgi:hypothetical protein